VQRTVGSVATYPMPGAAHGGWQEPSTLHVPSGATITITLN
jgi:hypothetical protein